MAPALSASRSGGPDGNSVHATETPRGASLASSVPLFLSSTSLPYFWKPMWITLSSAPAVPDAPATTAATVNAAIWEMMFMTDPPGGSGLRGEPDGIADHDRPGDEPQPVEPVGDGLLGRRDVVGQLADGERRAVGRDGLDLEIDTGDLGERPGHLI